VRNLGIIVNELFTGKKITMKDYDKFAEENVVDYGESITFKL
jgi:hypothetical protein